MKGTQIIIEALRREKVELVFGYIGAALIPLFHDLWECRDIRFVMPRHEQGGAHAADGYARATGRTGVVFATSGPGATNLVTGIATAHMDSVPMVAITGQVKTHLIGNDAFQEADMTGITRPITKQNYIVTDPGELPRIFTEAFHIARSGRPGPVHIDLPVDISTAEVTAGFPERTTLRGYRPKTEGNARQIERAAALINASERPVLYIGGGVVASGASAELRALAETASIPVTPTLMGKGAFPDSHPLCMGMLGMHGTGTANNAVMACDTLVAVGARFDDRVTGKLEEFAPDARIIHIDIDPTSVSKNVEVDVPLVGDAKCILAGLLAHVREASHEDWLARVASWREEFPLRYGKGSLRPQYILETLARLTEGRPTVYTTEVGQHQMWAALHLGCDTPRTFITSGGLGTMGYGLPAAIGAQLGRPDALVFDISGDGSLQMNIQELQTLRSQKLPVKVIVLNNGYLGMVRQWQELFYERRYANVDMEDNPDFLEIARAYRIKGIRIETAAEVEAKLIEAIETDGPVLVDAWIEREENVYPMVPAGAAINRMICGRPRDRSNHSRPRRAKGLTSLRRGIEWTFPILIEARLDDQ
jgi:acetolactate synthase I/II/III large subunit